MDFEKRHRILMLCDQILQHGGPRFDTDHIVLTGDSYANAKIKVLTRDYKGEPDRLVTVMYGHTVVMDGSWQDTIEEYLTNFLRVLKVEEVQTTLDFKFPTDNWLDRNRTDTDEILLWLKMHHTEHNWFPATLEHPGTVLKMYPATNPSFLADGYSKPFEYEGKQCVLLANYKHTFAASRNGERIVSCHISSTSIFKMIERGVYE